MSIIFKTRYSIKTEIWTDVVLEPSWLYEKCFVLHYPEQYANATMVQPGYAFDAVMEIFRQLDNNIVEKVLYRFGNGSEKIWIDRTTTKEQFFKKFLYHVEPNMKEISMKIEPVYNIWAGKEEKKYFVLKPSKEEQMYILTYKQDTPDYYISCEDVLEVIKAVFEYIDKDIIEIIKVSDRNKKFYIDRYMNDAQFFERALQR